MASNQITYWLTSELDALDRGVIHIIPSRIVSGSKGLHQASQCEI